MRGIRRCSFVTVTAFSLAASTVAAAGQDNRSGPVTSDPTKIVFEHDGANVAGFVAYISAPGKAARRVDLGALRADPSGEITAPLPPLPAGTYTLELAAYNAAGESERVPAEPRRFTISKARESIQSSPATAQVSEPAARPPDPTRATARPKKKGGLFGRVWKGVVGDDDADQGK